MLRLKRAYDQPSESDGHRILVDRLWPRGLSRVAAHLDEWHKEIAPSDALRKWFGHDPARWAGFRERYKKELDGEVARAELDVIAKRARRETVTLVYAAHDSEHNNAVVIAEEIGRRSTRPRAKSAAASKHAAVKGEPR